MKVLQFLDEFYIVLPNKEIFATKQGLPKKMEMIPKEYEKLDPKAKTKILYAYHLYQTQNV